MRIDLGFFHCVNGKEVGVELDTITRVEVGGREETHNVVVLTVDYSVDGEFWIDKPIWLVMRKAIDTALCVTAGDTQ